MIEFYSNSNDEICASDSAHENKNPHMKSYKESTGESKSTCLGSMSLDILNAQILEDMLVSDNKEILASNENFEQTFTLDLGKLGIKTNEIAPTVKRIRIKSIIPASSINHKPSFKSIKDLKLVPGVDAMKKQINV